MLCRDGWEALEKGLRRQFAGVNQRAANSCVTEIKEDDRPSRPGGGFFLFLSECFHFLWIQYELISSLNAKLSLSHFGPWELQTWWTFLWKKKSRKNLYVEVQGQLVLHICQIRPGFTWASQEIKLWFMEINVHQRLIETHFSLKMYCNYHFYTETTLQYWFLHKNRENILHVFSSHI